MRRSFGVTIGDYPSILGHPYAVGLVDILQWALMILLVVATFEWWVLIVSAAVEGVLHFLDGRLRRGMWYLGPRRRTSGLIHTNTLMILVHGCRK